MKDYYLAIDIGASSGRHILSTFENGKITLQEIYRFENKIIKKNGHDCWDTEKLFNEIKNGLKKAKENNTIPKTIAIDTWGIDFVLFDKNNNKIGDSVCYRDNRVNNMDKKVYELISEQKVYEKTGIQKLSFNTIFQFMSIKEDLNNADSFLMIPDYFNFLLTGVKKMEYTNATTTGLVNASKKTWDMDLISKLGYNTNIFKELNMPSTYVGDFTKEIQNEVGFNSKVIMAPSHDTASAVVAVPSNENCIYISSGTWSLMGTEINEPNCSEESRVNGFTNEGGYEYKFRFLKNIMGLWMIQSVKKEWNEELSFSEICEKASKESIDSIIDCNDERFLNPNSMINEIKFACEESGQKIPKEIGEIAAVVYNSLAKSYADTVKKIEKIFGKKYKEIIIVGGGANATYLNELTEKYCNKKVITGSSEATALGNIIIQLIFDKKINSLNEARKIIGG